MPQNLLQSAQPQHLQRNAERDIARRLLRGKIRLGDMKFGIVGSLLIPVTTHS